MARALFAVGLGAWIVGACVPVHSTVRNERSGRVIDAQSGKPIVGAIVRAESFRVPTPPGHGSNGTLVGSAEVKTGASGHWEISRDTQWGIGILAADGLPLFVEVHCVLADGYQSAVRNPHKDWLGLSLAPGRSVATDHEIEAEVRLERSPAHGSETTAKPQTPCGVPL
jgi:hypothetical protein